MAEAGRLNRVVFSHKSDEWRTPQSLFDRLNREFGFKIDLAAHAYNRKCPVFFGTGSQLDSDALRNVWSPYGVGWCNPPYSRCDDFVAKAAQERYYRFTTVMLLPARTDTRWFHQYIYQQPGVEVRFLKGRLKFSGSKNSAPFPSMIVIFRGV